MNEPTIAAIATAPGQGGVAIVRVSGPMCGRIAEKVFVHGPQRLRGASRPRFFYYGHVVDAQDAAVDEVLAVRFRAPHSYTGQDVLELQCHGGQVQAKRVLDAVLNAGAVLAQPGEFTKLAFLNGRIDLSQAEAVMQLVSARSQRAAQLSQTQLDGALSREIGTLSDALLDLMAAIGAAADYPQDDVDDAAARNAQAVLAKTAERLRALLRTADIAMKYQDGARVVIAGRPNAGKSSLLNALLGQERAIVTDVAGTTRDVLTEPLNLDGIPLTLCDTAGLRASGDVIERIGVERAKQELDRADLILLVRDLTAPAGEEDEQVLSCGKPLIVVNNKIDLTEGDAGAPETPDLQQVYVSAKTGAGMEALRAAMKRRIAGDEALSEVNLTAQRHVDAVKAALKALQTAQEGLSDGVPVDVIFGDVQEAWRQLTLITGQSADEALIDRIFSTFCLGK